MSVKNVKIASLLTMCAIFSACQSSPFGSLGLLFGVPRVSFGAPGIDLDTPRLTFGRHGLSFAGPKIELNCIELN